MSLPRPSSPRPGFVSCGAFSDSINLAHAPVISPLRNILRRLVSDERPAFLLIIVISAAVGVGGAWIFFKLIEEPVERSRRQLGKSPRPAILPS